MHFVKQNRRNKKYSNYSGRTIFSDQFQQSAHASPGNDFVYLLYTSVRSDVLKEHSDELLKTYEDAFLNRLKECEAPAEAIKTYEKPWFLDEVKLVGMFGMLIGVGFVHAVLGHGLDPFGGEIFLREL